MKAWRTPKPWWGLLVGMATLNGSTAFAAEGRPVAVDVHTTVVVRADLRRWVTAYGNVTPQPAVVGRRPAEATVSAVESGRITAVHVAEGDTVHAGQVLVELDARRADAAVARARAELAGARKEYARQEGLARTSDTSQKRLEEASKRLAEAEAALQQARFERSMLELSSPIDGTLVELWSRLGETLLSGSPAARIIDLNRLVASIRVPAPRARAVEIGQEARVVAATHAGTATVQYVAKNQDPRNGTVLVHLTLPPGWQPGEFVRAEIAVETHRNCLAVPSEAVVHGEEGEAWIFVVRDSVVRKVPVTCGIEEADLTEVRAQGVAEGTVVVTHEAYGLTDSLRIHALSD